LDDADYESVLLAGSHVCKSLLEEELEGLGRQPVIYSPLASLARASATPPRPTGMSSGRKLIRYILLMRRMKNGASPSSAYGKAPRLEDSAG
jgi:hypothetical protein